MSEKEIKFWFKLIASLVITTELYAYMIKQRGYLNPGGEVLIVPLLIGLKYLYKELKPIFVEMFKFLKEIMKKSPSDGNLKRLKQK